MNIVFFILVVASILTAAITGKINTITAEAITSAGNAVKQVFALVGILCFWLGIAKIAEKSGLIELFTKLLQPLIGWLFPSIPKGHPAMGAVLMNLSANVFGFGSAATPFGLKAMEHLQKLNRSDRASEAMCTFLAINSTSITLIPSTVIAIRTNAGSANPMEIISVTLFANTVSTIVAVCADLFCRIYLRKRGKL